MLFPKYGLCTSVFFKNIFYVTCSVSLASGSTRFQLFYVDLQVSDILFILSNVSLTPFFGIVHISWFGFRLYSHFVFYLHSLIQSLTELSVLSAIFFISWFAYSLNWVLFSNYYVGIFTSLLEHSYNMLNNFICHIFHFAFNKYYFSSSHIKWF